MFTMTETTQTRTEEEKLEHIIVNCLHYMRSVQYLMVDCEKFKLNIVTSLLAT
jgi:hypothetical protein